MLLSPLLATDTLPTPAPDSQAPFARYTWYINRIHRLYIVIPGLVWITTARLRRWPIKLATRHFRACSRAAWSSRHWCCLDAQRRGQGQEKVKRRKTGNQLAIASLALYSAILELLAPLPFALICLWPRLATRKSWHVATICAFALAVVRLAKAMGRAAAAGTTLQLASDRNP